MSTTTTTTRTVIWTSADGQSTIDMSGEYRADADADSVRQIAAKELIDQSATDDQQAAISAGSISVDGD